MKRYYLGSLFLILACFPACQRSTYKSFYQETWEQLLQQPTDFFLSYIKERPIFSDSFPEGFAIPEMFDKNSIKTEGYKWVLLKIRVVDVYVSSNGKKEIETFPIKGDPNKGVKFKKIEYAIYPYRDKSVEEKILNAYLEKKLLYLVGREEFKADGSLGNVLFLSSILEPNKKYSQELYPFPGKMDL